MYVPKVWMFRKSDENTIGIWERKILSKIFVSVKENDGWTISTVHEVANVCRETDSN
jgi:hypothetical protein